MNKPEKIPPTTDEREVLRRMLPTPPKPFTPKVKAAKKPASMSGTQRQLSRAAR